MFVTPAFAQTAAPGAGDFLSMILPLVMIMVIFYFLLIRPQQRKVKEHQLLISKVQRGDTVVTNGGLIGRVTKVTDDKEIQVEIAENVKVRLVRSAISDVRAKGEPVKDEAGK
ncbi:MAG: preprotein translocase subunit YajC [Rhizobiales bacterium]|nr:preprotein translocase subunit YajC [Hyphomicrobiales bacterium]